MDEMSYYSDDDESVCVGLTFTPAVANKLAQSSTNSTDSGVECTDQRLALECSTGSALDCTALEKNSQQSSIQDPHEITVLELLSNTCDSDINTKCETDSGCDVKPTAGNLEDIYPGISDAELLSARKQNLGGVKGGKVAALNARSLDILNGKFDEPSRKFALRPNPRAIEDSTRKDKRPCNKTPPSNMSRNQSSGIIYENVSTPSRNPVYVNYRPSRFLTPVKPRHCSNKELSTTPAPSPIYLTPMTAAKIVPAQRKGQDTVLYNTPVKRNYQSRYSSRAPAKETASPHSSPHHYELILSPDSTSSLNSTHTNSSPGPWDPPKPNYGPTETNTISSKSASPGDFLSPGEVAGDWGDGDSTIDKSIKSYHEAVRSMNRVPCSPTKSEVRSKSPSRENPIYSNTRSKSSRPHATQGIPSRGGATRAKSPGYQRGRSPRGNSRSPVRGRQYVNSGGDPVNDQYQNVYDNYQNGKNQYQNVNDQYQNVYDNYQNVYDRYTPPELQQMKKKTGRHYSVDSSPGHSTSTGSLSDTEYNRPAPCKRPTRPVPNKPLSTQPAKQNEVSKSRFRYSTSNVNRPNLSEDEQDENPKKGVVLIQATLEDVHSLYKVQDDIFELRFSDSGLTSDLIHLLGDLCNEKNIVRLIFEDCELDDWVLLSKV
ncbi:uncharacterized protein LOC134818969, partial [Bolinopsis microptera]|uniref:uncharacterized protein LOC134818969 n=1 Tax=Bolinopsis microptera TaxID=2820187 RepID=UPI00307A7B38